MIRSNVYYERYGYSEIDAAQFERARRRGSVDTFERCRSYNAILNWLNRRPVVSVNKFLTLGEAAHSCRIALQLAKVFGGDVDSIRERYVVARYFARQRFARPEAWNG